MIKLLFCVDVKESLLTRTPVDDSLEPTLSSRSRISSRERQIYIAIFALVIIYRLVIILFNRIDTDEMSNLSVAWNASTGVIPYRDFIWMFPPFQWLSFAPIPALFGDGVHTIFIARIFSVLLSVLTMWRLYAFGKKHIDERAAWLMPIIFSLTYNCARAGCEIRPDPLLFLLLVIELELLASLRLNSKARDYLAAGFVMAIATLVKQTAFVYGLAFVFFFIWNCRDKMRLDAKSFKRFFFVSFIALIPVILAWLVALAFVFDYLMNFLSVALLETPKIYSLSEYDFSPLWFGLTHSPVLVIAALAFIGINIIDIVRKKRVSISGRAAFALALATILISATARPFGEHFFLPIGLTLTFFIGSALPMLEAISPRTASKIIFTTICCFAINAAVIEPYRSSRLPAYEHVFKQVAVIDFVLKHTPKEMSVLSSHPMWIFRHSKGFNPPNLHDLMFYLKNNIESEQKNKWLKYYTNQAVTQPVVFVIIDGWMKEIIDAFPVIADYVVNNFEIYYYKDGEVILGVHRQHGVSVPRDKLTPIQWAPAR